MSGLSNLVVLLSCLSLFLSADCTLDVGAECALSGLLYGGRLLPSQDGPTHPWNRHKIFVFQTTKQGRDRFGMNGGRGRVWVTSGLACPGSNSPLEVCPSRENIPCMDTSIPCRIDIRGSPPSYVDGSPLTFSEPTASGVKITRPEWNQAVDFGAGPVVQWMIQYREDDGPVQNITKHKDVLSHRFNLRPGTFVDVRIALRNTEGYGTFSDWQNFTIPCGDVQVAVELETSSRRTGSAKVMASWELRTLCRVKKQTIHFQQLDRDNCSPEESGILEDLPRDVETHETRTFAQKGLYPNSLFKVIITVVTTDDRVFSSSETIRTAKTAPTGKPIVEEPQPLRRNRIVFRWSALECGDRNADAISYEYRLESTSYTRTETISERRKRFEDIPTGEDYTFKVRARSAEGVGEYSDVKTGTF